MSTGPLTTTALTINSANPAASTGGHRFRFNAIAASLATTAPQAIPNALSTTLNFGTVEFDTDGMTSLSDLTRFTVKISGYYRVTCLVAFDPTKSGGTIRQVYIILNNVYEQTSVGQNPPVSGATRAAPMQVSFLGSIQAGSWITFQVYQDSGATINTATWGAVYAWADIQYIGE